jgi:hypothetical protein
MTWRVSSLEYVRSSCHIHYTPHRFPRNTYEEMS